MPEEKQKPVDKKAEAKKIAEARRKKIMDSCPAAQDLPARINRLEALIDYLFDRI